MLNTPLGTAEVKVEHEDGGAATRSHPLASVQRIIWLDETLNPGSTHYNIGVAMRLEGDLDADIFRIALNTVVNSNTALRLSFAGSQRRPEQRLLGPVAVPLAVLDLIDEDGSEESARQYMRRVFSEPVSPWGLLPWESQLLRASRSGYYWLQRYHHMVMDGFGVQLIINYVLEEYDRRVKGRLDSAEQRPSYLEFVGEDQRYLGSQRFHSDAQFWRERFPTAPAGLIQHQDGAEHEVAPGEQLRWSIPRPLFESINAYIAEHGLSITH